ncbi:kinase-like domain-containing protein [Clohesyomyces aquaticus]|uniref:Kinase-like domain-containing protein n=1 Tax=Clohesyomyces aquaticus TaxID=1231657 RepID=A0A1Y1ZVN8_9PLEO|nr:kinase-like domain-containing protein [Clohesyomyces aquaticus]
MKLALSQLLRGRVGSYVLTKALANCAWMAGDQNEQHVITKNLLKHFQHRTPFPHPLIDEIEDPSDPPAILLRWLDDDALDASNSKRFTRSEVKFVAKGVLEALSGLHSEGYVHCDVNPSNILVNRGTGDGSITEVQLADLGGTMGAEIFRSPEAQLQLEWAPACDIWSFGPHSSACCTAKVPRGDESYSLNVLLKHVRIFRPWSVTWKELVGDVQMGILIYTMEISPKEALKPFKNNFVLKIMKLDPRDRPSAQELLRDEWFKEEIVLDVKTLLRCLEQCGTSSVPNVP